MNAVTLAILGLFAGYALVEAFPYVRRFWSQVNTSNLQRWRDNQKRARNAGRVFSPTCACGQPVTLCPDNCDGRR